MPVELSVLNMKAVVVIMIMMVTVPGSPLRPWPPAGATLRAPTATAPTPVPATPDTRAGWRARWGRQCSTCHVSRGVQGCSDIDECTHSSWNYYVSSYCKTNAHCVNQVPVQCALIIKDTRVLRLDIDVTINFNIHNIRRL